MTTYNTIVKSNEINVLDEVVKRCPYECAELEPGKYGFMDNEKGDVRNYFCDTLGYECSNYEAFDFEYFDEPPKEIDVTDILEKVDFAKAAKAFIQEWRNNNPYPGSDYLDEFNAKFNREYSEFVEKWAKDNGTQINSYMFPNPYPIERGEYKETELDRQKKQADILLESIDGNWYTIRLNKGIEIKSKRIRNYDNGTIAIPESLFHKLESKYNVMCNF